MRKYDEILFIYDGTPHVYQVGQEFIGEKIIEINLINEHMSCLITKTMEYIIFTTQILSRKRGPKP